MAASSAFGNVGIIPSLALFRGVTAAALPPVLFLQGTVTPNDGGQGFYSVNLTDKSTPDNGTSVIVDGGGYRWELVTADTATQIVAALSFGGTLPAIDPLLGGIASIAAATTTNLASVTQAVVTITGSGVTITSLGTLGAGRLRWVRFADVNTLDHDATALILPGGANITTAANDAAVFLSLGSGNWQCIDYTEASGGTPGVLPISEGGTGQITAVLAAIALSPKGADIASAGTINLAAATGPVLDITGSTGPVTSLGTVAAGARFLLRFTGTPTLTNNAVSLILPTGADIVVAAGDVALFTSLGSGNWYCAGYQRATGLPLATVPLTLGGTGQITAVLSAIALSPKGADIASAATIDLATATGPVVDITGNTGPVTSLGTVAAGAQFQLRFMSTPTLTHNATSLILPTGANIVAAAGDTARVVSLGSGNWVCVSYERANGQALAYPTPLSYAITNSGFTITREYDSSASPYTWTKPTGLKAIWCDLRGSGGGGGGGVRQAIGNAGSGGGGGGGGSSVGAFLDAADLGATETVTVPAGGAGGAGSTSDGVAGANGSVGGNTTFGSHLTARGGGLGAGGQPAGNSGGGGGGGIFSAGGAASTGTGGAAGTGGPAGAGGSGAAGSTGSGGGGGGGGGGPNGAAGAAGGNAGGSPGGGSGGGSGGGIAAVPADTAGGSGGLVIGGSGGSGGSSAVGASGTQYGSGAGSGGGGGGSNASGAGYAGGAGATGGGGGGGGGAGGNSNNGGAGAAGGSGFARIVEFY